MATDKKSDSHIQSGTDIPQPEFGKLGDWLFNHTNLFRQVVAGVVSWLNLSVIVTLKKSDGTSQSMPAVKPVITGKNSTLTLPIDVSSLGSGAGGNSRVFEGAGPPSAGTLTAIINYLAAPNPDLYVDTTNTVLYYCSLAGTNTTSGWAQASARVRRGSGAPTVASLTVGNYSAGPMPDLYIDTTNNNIYYCSTSGTQSTSIWKILSGLPAFALGQPVGFEKIKVCVKNSDGSTTQRTMVIFGSAIFQDTDDPP